MKDLSITTFTKVFLSACVLFFSQTGWASDYIHLIDGGIDLANLKIEPDNQPARTENTFNLRLNYRNQFQPTYYIVANFEFLDDEVVSLFNIGGGLEKKLLGGGSVEIGPGAIFFYANGEYNDNEYDAFGILPYAFLRSFIGQSRAYVMWTLGYRLAFADRNEVDEDQRGIDISFGFGLAF